MLLTEQPDNLAIVLILYAFITGKNRCDGIGDGFDLCQFFVPAFYPEKIKNQNKNSDESTQKCRVNNRLYRQMIQEKADCKNQRKCSTNHKKPKFLF